MRSPNRSEGNRKGPRSPRSIPSVAALIVLLSSVSASPGSPQVAAAGDGEVPEVVGHVRFEQKISQTAGGFTGTLPDGSFFGSGSVALGDLDGDGTVDLAVGAPFDSDGGILRGAVWILFLHPNGTVKSHQKISDTEGGFTGTLDDQDGFGSALAPLGDLDGDGTADLAVGAWNDDDGGLDRGAVWILFLHPNGTVKDHQKISATEGGFTGTLDLADVFGSSLAFLADLDGAGTAGLAVGAQGDDDGGPDRGAVWILFLNPDGTVEDYQKISSTEGGFTGTLTDGDRFGSAVTFLGDLDRDGAVDLAVGARVDDEGGIARGAVWILFLHPDSTVKSHQKISSTQGGFTGTLDDFDQFGFALSSSGDLNCDGVRDLAVGATGDDDGGDDRGAVWLLFLNTDGTVRLHTKISDESGGFTGTLDNNDRFGSSVGPLGDIDGDGNVDLAVGAPQDGDGGQNRGAAWILFLDGGGCFDPFLFADGFESGDTTEWSETEL